MPSLKNVRQICIQKSRNYGIMNRSLHYISWSDFVPYAGLEGVACGLRSNVESLANGTPESRLYMFVRKTNVCMPEQKADAVRGKTFYTPQHQSYAGRIFIVRPFSVMSAYSWSVIR